MKINQELPLQRCPHCRIAFPRMTQQSLLATTAANSKTRRHWGIFICSSCGGVVTALADSDDTTVKRIWPSTETVSSSIPERAREYLEQAMASLHSPAGAVMLTASAIDAMLKSKGMKSGNLFSRIDAAVAAHLITPEMAAWAHDIRLDANDQRHADDNAPLPALADAEKVIAFAQALGEFLYVLPDMVERGRNAGKKPDK